MICLKKSDKGLAGVAERGFYEGHSDDGSSRLW